MKSGCFEPNDFKGHQVWRCFHSGDLGDIIYSLLFCRSLGQVQLLLGPAPNVQLRQQMNPTVFAWLVPLLRIQPWITSVQYTDHIPSCDYNLNDHRFTWFSQHSGFRKHRRLFETYAEHFRKPPLPENDAWLKVDPIIDLERPVVIARSPRFHGQSFPWKTISNRYVAKMRFVGLKSEYKEWTDSFGKTADYQPVKDALEMARIIAGAELFIGNQSFPMALALALKVSIVQETCPITPDCVFKRPNVIYSHQGPIRLPSLKPSPMRSVSAQKNKDGLFELGPCDQATGLGDTLSITPLAAALGDRAVMLMPSKMKHQAFVFKGLCQVKITEDYPVFRWVGLYHAATGKLRIFGLATNSPLPAIKLDPEIIHRSKPLLDGLPNPIAFVPTCSAHWAHIRQRPFTFWKGIVEELSKRYTVCQFGLADYPTVPKSKRMPFVDLETLAALYQQIGRYCGVHTGDHHLMLAVGGRCVVAEPEPIPEFHSALWSYDSPRIVYGKLSHPHTVLDAIKRLPL